MKVFLTNFHYKKHFTPVQMIMAGVLYAVLSLPSLVYLCIVKTRNFLYKKAICFKASFNTSSTVISSVSSTPLTAFNASDEEYPNAVNA